MEVNSAEGTSGGVWVVYEPTFRKWSSLNITIKVNSKERRRVAWKCPGRKGPLREEVKVEGAISVSREGISAQMMCSRYVYIELHPVRCTGLLAALSGHSDVTKASIWYLLLFLFRSVSWYCIVYLLLCDRCVLVAFVKLLGDLNIYIKKVL